MAIKEQYEKYTQSDPSKNENDTGLINKNLYQIYEFYGSPEPLKLLQHKFTRLNQIIKSNGFDLDQEFVIMLEKGFLAFYSYLLNIEKYLSIPSITPLEDDSIDFRWKTKDYDILLNIDDDYTFTMDTDIYPNYSESVFMPLRSMFERLLFNVINIDTSIDKTVTSLIEEYAD